jgi:hypothetical protein
MFRQTTVLRKDGDRSWFGAEYTPTGEVREAGTNPEECRSCHGAAATTSSRFERGRGWCGSRERARSRKPERGPIREDWR